MIHVQILLAAKFGYWQTVLKNAGQVTLPPFGTGTTIAQLFSTTLPIQHSEPPWVMPHIVLDRIGKAWK